MQVLTINSSASLRQAIEQLEQQQAIDKQLMKEQFTLAYESVQPINLIKSTIKQVVTSTEIKDEVFNASVGLATGYLTKSLVENVSNKHLKTLLGSIVQISVTSYIVENPDVVKAIGRGFFNLLRNKKMPADQQNTEPTQ